MPEGEEEQLAATIRTELDAETAWESRHGPLVLEAPPYALRP